MSQKQKASSPPVTLGVILAGGQSRRFGSSHKFLADLGGKTLLAHILDGLRPQVDLCLINANDDAAFAAYHTLTVTDILPGNLGPLAGLLSAMEWAHTNAPSVTYIASCSSDTPFLPRDLVQRLETARDDADADIAVARSLGAAHYTTALWPIHLAGPLREAIIEAQMRSVKAFTAGYSAAYADFSAEPVDPFFNINTQEDLAQARAFLQKIEG